MIKRKNIMYEVARMLLLLFLVSFLAFLLIAKSPIDPLSSYIGTNSTLSPEAKAEIVNHWGLNDSIPHRYLTWLVNVCHGDMGMSISYKKEVVSVIKERFALENAYKTEEISRQGGFFDRITKSFCLLVKSAPTFWIGILFLVVFAVELGWFPIGMAVPMGKLESEVTLGDRIYHLILPVITLTIASISEIVLYTRQRVVEIINSDFILYARARGENTWQIVTRHVLRNALLPAITLQFASFSELFGGMALAENVFSYPGIGTATTTAALNGDAPLLMGIALISAVFVFTGNMIANILYKVCDPRIREGENAR